MYASLLRAFVFLLLLAGGALAQSGFVRSNGQPIPGATVTATQGAQSFSTVTDADGHYGFPPLGPGAWNVSVEMFGFDTLQQQVDYASQAGAVNFELHLKQSPMVQRMQQFAAAQRGRTTNSATTELDALLAAEPQTSAAGTQTGNSGNDAFLISGSLSPGLAQGAAADAGGPSGGGGLEAYGTASATNSGYAPGFAQGASSGFGGGGGPGFVAMGPGGGFGGPGGGRGRPGARGGPGRPPAQFGNRRRRNEQLHGQASFTFQNSAANAKPFSLNGLDIPQAAYAQMRFSFIIGGPLVIPKIAHDTKTQFFLTYFGTRARTPELFVETVPDAAFRQGNFSQAVQSTGANTSVPVQIFDPTTHQPFANNIIPRNRLNPIALSLLNYYPLPNEPGLANNYQYETAQATNSDNVGLRIQRSITSVDRLALNFQYQDRNGTTAQPFGYSDETDGYGLNSQLQWMRNLSPTALNVAQLRFNRNYTNLTPYFSLGPDVAAELGIPGTSSDPRNYGPPTLNFTNFASLSDGTATLNRNQSLGASDSLTITHGTHNFTFGGGYTRADLSTRTDPNGRGTFNFTGVATSAIGGSGSVQSNTGYDLADFLLGFPQSSSIQYSGFNEYFRQNQWNGYAQDEWKARANLTLILGVRYEYFSPFMEKYGRMANLDIAPGYTAVSVATPDQPGKYTGAFPDGLINPDLNNWSPRLGLAWKVPNQKRSTIVRAGYGIYYNGQAYNQFATLLAYQPPFAVSNSVNTSVNNVLTLGRGFLAASPRDVTNTFAVDRNYRTPYAGSWSLTVQREFGGGFFGEIGYLGTKGTRLDVRTLPNQAEPGTPILPTELRGATGFTYDQSIGDSIFHALQLRLNRRFNHGLSFSAFYQFAKSIDDSSTFGGAGNTVAQNWLDIAAERGLSSFDVRHEFTTNFVWTSPVAGPGSHIAPDSKTARLLKDWQISGAVTAQTGNPLTARVLGNTQQLAQTGGIGKGRAEATGEPIDSGSGFFNLNAFTTPLDGAYGDAGRNTIPGPGLFNLNLAFARSFTFAERRRLEFRVESNNVLNHVNYTSLYTVVNAVNYGLPSAAGAMRTLNVVLRFRF
ncbi:MAG TPA: TonB-dependent receptor [Bryobacteraceae bacterium]|nr:TonB-dependent receptor [Bryobacteraceae bacterium]